MSPEPLGCGVVGADRTVIDVGLTRELLTMNCNSFTCYIFSPTVKKCKTNKVKKIISGLSKTMHIFSPTLKHV